jgi:hypothetical protein
MHSALHATKPNDNGKRYLALLDRGTKHIAIFLRDITNDHRIAASLRDRDDRAAFGSSIIATYS